MRRITIVLTLAAVALIPTAGGFAQQAGSDVKKELEALKEGQAKMQRDLELKKELDALKEGQAKLQKDLQEIKAMLQARPAGAQVKGNKNAKLTLVEFTDYQCPFCARHIRDTWPQIDKDYVQTGKVRYVL